ncbi:MAG TPA: rhodanese-like domain-containing protein [Bacteroidales bacterium]|nr:rhodanese-like domain-containing protein [Bacteroidales bacterium]
MKKSYSRLPKNILMISCIVMTLNQSLSGQQSQPDRVSPLVSAEWVKQNSTNPGVVILHVSSTKRDYENGHIPGARFLWPGHIIIATENESTFPAPEEDAAKKLRELGVNNESHIILCGIYGNVIQVSRIFVNLEHYGLRGKVSILNGGFEAWMNAGYESSQTIPQVKKGRFKPLIINNLVNGEFVKANLKNSAYVITDARPKAQYDGTTGAPRPGHIPGTKNLPQPGMYDGKSFMFNSPESIKAAFDKLNIPPGSRPLFYCHTGNSASIDYVAAIVAGYEPLIYDGSMEEWSSRFEWPVEK